MRSIRLVAIALAGLLAGCAGLLPQESLDQGQGNPVLWQQHRQQVAQIDGWQISGKVGIRAPQSSGSGTLFWLQRGDYFDIRLSGPLGRGAARLTGHPGDTVLEVANQGRYQSTPGPCWKRNWAGACRFPICSGGCAACRPRTARPAQPQQQQPAWAAAAGRLADRLPRLHRAKRLRTAQRLKLQGHNLQSHPGHQGLATPPPRSMSSMQHATLILPAPAKLNLFLHITGRRADGYHELQTLFQFLDHGDKLGFLPCARTAKSTCTPRSTACRTTAT